MLLVVLPSPHTRKDRERSWKRFKKFIQNYIFKLIETLHAPTCFEVTQNRQFLPLLCVSIRVLLPQLIHSFKVVLSIYLVIFVVIGCFGRCSFNFNTLRMLWIPLITDMDSTKNNLPRRRHSDWQKASNSWTFRSLRESSGGQSIQRRPRFSTERPDNITFGHFGPEKYRRRPSRRRRRRLKLGFCLRFFPTKIFVRLSRRYRECTRYTFAKLCFKWKGDSWLEFESKP